MSSYCSTPSGADLARKHIHSYGWKWNLNRKFVEPLVQQFCESPDAEGQAYLGWLVGRVDLPRRYLLAIGDACDRFGLTRPEDLSRALDGDFEVEFAEKRREEAEE